MSERSIFAFVGNPDCGKTTTAKAIKDAHSSDTEIVSSTFIREWAARFGIDLPTRQDYGRFHRSMQEQFGVTVLAEQWLQIDAPIVIIDGARNFSNVEKIKKHGAIVVAFWCPLEVRYARAASEASDKGFCYKSIDEYRAAEAGEYQSPDAIGSHIITNMQMADHHVDASRPKDIVIADVRTRLAL